MCSTGGKQTAEPSKAPPILLTLAPGGIHDSAYWKVYKVVEGEVVVLGRTGGSDFANFDQVVDSPGYANGILRN